MLNNLSGDILRCKAVGIMATSPALGGESNVRWAKSATRIACLIFPFAFGLSPGPGSSLGMPWLFFFVTWGVVFVASLIALLNFCAAKQQGARIGIFYVICPGLLLGAFIVFLNFWDIVHAILNYEGVA